mmetsp:Transcript_3117/g.8687  ORF Transcript_3117/g.8687 Transcript_3117/m.8687 type:complete len:216 (+) Transcript_3117:271-918(+)
MCLRWFETELKFLPHTGHGNCSRRRCTSRSWYATWHFCVNDASHIEHWNGFCLACFDITWRLRSYLRGNVRLHSSHFISPLSASRSSLASRVRFRASACGRVPLMAGRPAQIARPSSTRLSHANCSAQSASSVIELIRSVELFGGRLLLVNIILVSQIPTSPLARTKKRMSLSTHSRSLTFLEQPPRIALTLETSVVCSAWSSFALLVITSDRVE